jgi:ATP diphosphatase
MDERPDVAGALVRLDELTRILRAECPWDREQDEKTIVPHTVEEAYELADAANLGDDVKLVDELGDVLFQVHFLSLLLEERGAGDLADVADGVREKLIRRHPHVFPPDAPLPVELGTVDTSGDVLQNWDAIKSTEAGREPGIFGEVPENLPALLHARKVQRRAASNGLDARDTEVALAGVEAYTERLAVAQGDRDATFAQLGDLLFAVVNVARILHADPELALRAASARFRGAVESAEARALSEGHAWADLSEDQKLQYYALIRMESSS